MASRSSSPEMVEVSFGGTVSGRVAVPSSKSVTHRYLNLGLLAGGKSVVERPLEAEDIMLFYDALRTCGWRVSLEGTAGTQRAQLEPPDGTHDRVGSIDCGNAGTLYRFLVASLAVVPGRWRIDGTPRLRERPIGALVQALRSLGADIDYLERERYCPLQVLGGSLVGGETELDASESSQYLSALLMAATGARRPVSVHVRALVSSPYVDITLQALERFGCSAVELRDGIYTVQPCVLRAGRYRVEGDYSAAAYPAAAAALTGGNVVIEGVSSVSKQGDRRFLDLLEQMGARVTWHPDRIEVAGGSLEAVDVDMADMPDQVPTAAALAPFCHGTTVIRNVPHLRIKESDRLHAMTIELRRLGAIVEEEPDGLIIQGTWAALGDLPDDRVVVSSHDDHRIAMSLALVGLRRPGVVVAEPGVVAKSYPQFWQDLATLLRS